jgi:hypothetical protein
VRPDVQCGGAGRTAWVTCPHGCDAEWSPEETPDGAAQKLAQLSTTYKRINAPMKEASGLGPGAFYTEDRDTGQTSVYFGKGNLFLELTHKVGKQSDPKAALALAKLVYGRL